MTRIATLARIRARPGQFEALLEETRRFLTQIDSEEGTDFFAVNVATDTPDTIWFYEIYRDESALQAHVSSEAMATYAAALGSLAEPDIELHRMAPEAIRGSGPVTELPEREAGR
jgi:quinol monooxygenase YgiN